ncbi:MAG: polysaccharide biosynthesis tyrosine autokinase [Thermosynechococcaceae cyanobacterium MS004]|nr:polysaccharide biosynthesis tyrosine autokinase [Thermosynechococcaceae cyanobacterium MS004]
MHPEREEAALHSARYEAEEYLGLDNAGAAAGAKQRGLNLNPFQRLLKRNALLIGIPTLTAAVLTGVIISLTPQKYSGSFQVLVEPMSGGGRLAQPSLVVSPESANSTSLGVDYLTLIRVLTSPSVLAEITQKIRDRYPRVTLTTLNRWLKVDRVEQNPAEQTKILETRYESADPDEVLYVLNELASGYLKFGLEDRKRDISRGITFIEQQLPELKRRVNTLEGQLQNLQQQYKISDLDSEGTQLAQQSRQIQTQQLETQRDLAAQKNLAQNLQTQLGGLSPQQVLKVSSLSENPRYQALLSQLKELEAKLALESANFQPEFPGIQTLEAQRKNLTDLLAQESQKLVGSNAVPQFQNSIQKSMSQQLIDSLNQVQVLEVRNQALAQANAAVEQQVRQFPVIKRSYNDVTAQLEIAQNTLKQLQLKREALRVEAAQKEVPWRLLSKPDLLRNSLGQPIKSSRKGLQRLLLGMLGGFLLGLGAAILREKRKDIFFSLEDLQDSLQWPILGSFPFSEKAAESGGRSLMAAGDQETAQGLRNPASLTGAAEALYTSLRFLPIEPGLRSLVISSSNAKDGKTTAITHLAKAAASMGQRVLVVDANMVLPQIHVWLDVPNFEGLVEVLTKSIDPNQLIQRSPLQSNLFVLPAGQVSQGSRKLMASQQMQHLMSQLHTMFDLVLYDTPPLQGQPDANFLALSADGLLLVVSIKKTRRAQFFRLLKKFQQTERIPLLGVIANQVKVQESGASVKAEEEFAGFEDEFEMFRIPSSQN